MEEYAYVLDYLPNGTSGGFAKKEPVCYALGYEEFKLFELVTKKAVATGDKVYIGKEASMREAIDHVKRRVGAKDISRTADVELDYAIESIVLQNETRFLRFYNESGPISLKKHMLEELPGLGKKTMQVILEERKKGPFTSFVDLAERTGLKAPEKLIAERIALEIRDDERRRYLFVSK